MKHHLMIIRQSEDEMSFWQECIIFDVIKKDIKKEVSINCTLTFYKTVGQIELQNDYSPYVEYYYY